MTAMGVGGWVEVDPRHRRMRLGDGDSGLKAAEYIAGLLNVRAQGGTNGNAELDSAGAFIGTFLHDSDDAIRFIFNEDVFANDVGVRVVAMRPNPVVEHHHMVVAGTAFIRKEVAAEEHFVAHRNGVHSRGEWKAAVFVLGVVGVGEVQDHPRLKIEALKGVALGSVVCVVFREGGSSLAFVVGPHHDQLFRVRIRKPREESGPDDAEDSHIGSDSESQCQYRSQCEPWRSPQLTKGITHISPKPRECRIDAATGFSWRTYGD